MGKFRVYVILMIRRIHQGSTGREGEIRFDPGSVKTPQVRPVGAIDCSPPTVVAYGRYSIEEIRRTALVAQNDCGRAIMKPLPGRLVIY
jgi:hypothetical protein